MSCNKKGHAMRSLEFVPLSDFRYRDFELLHILQELDKTIELIFHGTYSILIEVLLEMVKTTPNTLI
ncbi:hypothetical protein [Xenorhabdus entomophaga]|uniref:hypothetical protein n=1 Tax=Xenorhabdus entomophaga TaxID=3136257 RepID=UPI0030F4A6BF